MSKNGHQRFVGDLCTTHAESAEATNGRRPVEEYVEMVQRALAFLRAYHGPVPWLAKLAQKARAQPSFIPTDKDVVKINVFAAQIRKNHREGDHGLHALPTALD